MNRIQPIISLDRICLLLKVTTVEDYDNNLHDSDIYSAVYCEAKERAIDSGATEQDAEIQAESAAVQAEQDERDECVNKYIDAVLFVADKLFREHKLLMTSIESGRNRGHYRIVPISTWKDAAVEIITTINGVGYFGFNSVREFYNSGPYTPMAAVLHHLGWIADWPSVYEGGTAESMINRRLRQR